MERIDPICEEKILPYKGQRVYAVLRDGRYVFGTIDDVKDGQLWLCSNRNEQVGNISNTKDKKRKKTRNTSQKAAISTFGYPYYGGYGDHGSGVAIAVSLALIALLFVVPAYGYPYYK